VSWNGWRLRQIGEAPRHDSRRIANAGRILGELQDKAIGAPTTIKGGLDGRNELRGIRVFYLPRFRQRT
jgi:hypothetical protein